MTASVTFDPATATYHCEHQITVAAPAGRVYELIADVRKWPQIFGPTVHAECTQRHGTAEQIRLWATANGAVKTWVSRREHDPEAMSIAFRQEQSQHPVGGMGGTWVVEPVADGPCRVRLLHDYFPATSDPADADWIAKAVDRNSTAELQALKRAAEAGGSPAFFTFGDTVEVAGAAQDVYSFLDQADLWEQRLPHVARVSLQEDTPGLQILEMDTRTKDGSVHTTRSVRVCMPYHTIVYKQIVLPKLLALHTGRWLIADLAPGRVSVTSEHTVRIEESSIHGVLGTGADLVAAQAFVRNALSGNSLATLGLAKRHAEDVRRRG